MPAVFVHGNPETSAIWGPLVHELERSDVILLSPPGFGAPVEASFAGTATVYRDWLIAELEAIGEPVDLVGHDWGGGHVLNAMMLRPELARSWSTDVAGIFHPDYEWHDAAQVWISEGAGEENVGGMVAAGAEARAELFEGLGMTPDIAAQVAAEVNEDMARMILTLYRSAAQPALEASGRSLPNAAATPGLVIIASGDSYVGTESMARHSAQQAGAEAAVLNGVGHWWMIQDPALGAQTLQHFWDSI